MILGRAVAGLGIGSCAISVPAFLGEIAPVKQRGAVVQTYEVGTRWRGFKEGSAPLQQLSAVVRAGEGAGKVQG
jgi:hypothetical protein